MGLTVSHTDTNVHQREYTHGTNKNLIELIRSNNGLTQKQSTDIVEATIGTIKDTFASGEDVLVSGFGKFSVREKAQRRGRNPATGADQMLRARKVVTFKCSAKLRERINGL
jgi:integration host factor subunit alpha